MILSIKKYLPFSNSKSISILSLKENTRWQKKWTTLKNHELKNINIDDKNILIKHI